MAEDRDEKGGVAAALPTDALKEAGSQLLVCSFSGRPKPPPNASPASPTG